MSSQDSVSTVFKCMLNGAVDFLIKPVRRNELRNLWQHVWRRQYSSTSTVCRQYSSSSSIPSNCLTYHNPIQLLFTSYRLPCLLKIYFMLLQPIILLLLCLPRTKMKLEVYNFLLSCIFLQFF